MLPIRDEWPLFSFEISFFCFITQMGKSPLHSHMFPFSKFHLLVKMLIVLWNESASGLESKDAHTKTCSRWHREATGLSLQGLSRWYVPCGLPHSRALEAVWPGHPAPLQPQSCHYRHGGTLRKAPLRPNSCPLQPPPSHWTEIRCHCSTSLCWSPYLLHINRCNCSFLSGSQGANKVPQAIVLSI